MACTLSLLVLPNVLRHIIERHVISLECSSVVTNVIRGQDEWDTHRASTTNTTNGVHIDKLNHVYGIQQVFKGRARQRMHWYMPMYAMHYLEDDPLWLLNTICLRRTVRDPRFTEMEMGWWYDLMGLERNRLIDVVHLYQELDLTAAMGLESDDSDHTSDDD